MMVFSFTSVPGLVFGRTEHTMYPNGYDSEFYIVFRIV